MFNERAFIQQLETANTPELTQLVLRPTVEEEKSLRLYLGTTLNRSLNERSVR